MRFTGGAIGHKSTQGAMKMFSQESYELGDNHECETGVQEEGSGDPDVEAGDFDAVGDQDELGVIDKEEGAESEEEIEYGYRMVDDEFEGEDEPKDDSDDGDECIDLGPEDGEECWEDSMLDLEGYAEL
jgi:hypothetical protein